MAALLRLQFLEAGDRVVVDAGRRVLRLCQQVVVRDGGGAEGGTIRVSVQILLIASIPKQFPILFRRKTVIQKLHVILAVFVCEARALPDSHCLGLPPSYGRLQYRAPPIFQLYGLLARAPLLALGRRHTEFTLLLQRTIPRPHIQVFLLRVTLVVQGLVLYQLVHQPLITRQLLQLNLPIVC